MDSDITVRSLNALIAFRDDRSAGDHPQGDEIASG